MNKIKRCSRFSPQVTPTSSWKETGDVPVKAGGPLQHLKASWKDGEVKVSPKAAGNIYNSECQADQCKGSSQFPFQKTKCLFLISEEMNKILRYFWYFQFLLMRSNRFLNLLHVPLGSLGGDGMGCYYSRLHSHFYLTFSFLPFMLLLSDICSEIALFLGLAAHQASHSGFYGVCSDQESSFCITLQTIWSKSNPSADVFNLAALLNHLLLPRLLEWDSSLELAVIALWALQLI